MWLETSFTKSLLETDNDDSVIRDSTLGFPRLKTIGKVAVLINQGSGMFAAPVTLDVGIEPGSVISGQLNNDSHLDLAVANFDDGSTRNIDSKIYQ